MSVGRAVAMCFGLVGLYQLTAPAPAQEEELPARVKRAVERGVEHLQARTAKGVWSAEAPQATGLAALVGWTLLETGVRPADPSIQKVAALVRRETLTLTYTYSVSLAVLFLDRLGEAKDRPLIESLAARLLGGMTKHGGWFYNCPPLSDQEQQWAKARLRKAAENPPAKDEARKADPELVQLIEALRGRNEIAEVVGDNSNTQFAMMALWVARRHGVPVDAALTKVEARFRRMQTAAGGWTYVVPLGGFDKNPATPSMTSAGLLGIALGHGVKAAPKKTDILKDATVKKGLAALSPMLDELGRRKQLADNDLYALWSLERMAVVYDLKRIGERDWYDWGAELLLRTQNDEGGWDVKYPVADTCFALLFLKKANVAHDLTLNLLKGVVKDRPDDPGKEKKDFKKSDPEKKEPRLELPRVPPPKLKASAPQALQHPHQRTLYMM